MSFKILTKIFFSVLLQFLLFLGLTTGIFAQDEFFKDEIIVKIKPFVKEEILENLNKVLGTSLKSKLLLPQTFVLKVPEGQVERLTAIFSKNPLIEYAEPNYKAYALETTNDPKLPDQWGLFKVSAASNSGESAWNITHGLGSIKIAILDTGIDKDHGDLASKVALVDRINFTSSPSDDDLYGHGTHVAGIAAAVTNNGIGVAGLGYNSSLMSVKVLGDDGSGAYSWVANGIIWASQKGAKVINMSLGGSFGSYTLQNAVNSAWQKGVVIVAAAGNSANPSRTYPAYYNKVIAVAATDINDQKAGFSSFGKWVDVAAPGVDILSTFPNHTFYLGTKYGKPKDYGLGSGTSMATPFVSGLAGLLFSTSYGTSNTLVRYRIESTADKIPGTGKYWTYGRINALKAVK